VTGQRAAPSPYFLHIPKTAGTSINAWLDSCPTFRPCPHGLWSALLEEGRDALDRYDLFHGHFYCYLAEFLRRPLATFTVLRHPFERALSHFHHIQRDQRHYFHEKVIAQGSFLRFIEDPSTQVLVRDFQTRALTARFDPVALSRNPPSHAAHPFWLEQHLETAPSGIDRGRSLALAKEALDACIAVGLSERLPETIRCLAETLGLSEMSEIRVLNAAPSGPKSRIGEAELEALRELNRLDLELYEYAAELLDRSVCRSETVRC
jgi:hypothetical protein